MGGKKSTKVNQEGELGGKAFLYASPGITSKEVAMSWDFYKVTKWMNVSLELNLWFSLQLFIHCKTSRFSLFNCNVNSHMMICNLFP
jgi:hypothetical protein